MCACVCVLAVANTGSCLGRSTCSSLQTTDAGSRVECPRNVNKRFIVSLGLRSDIVDIV